jgi:hypothetical protein
MAGISFNSNRLPAWNLKRRAYTYHPKVRTFARLSSSRRILNFVGDPGGSLTLFEASRLLLRNSAAPFRSAGHLAFSPRPYQFVPLIMALRQSPVRLLVADDMGVGKTIEAGMIARQLLDRGVAGRPSWSC